MCIELNFAGYREYFERSFFLDFERLNGKPLKGAFNSSVEEAFYACTYILLAAAQKFLDPENKAPLEPIDLNGYGSEMAVAFGIVFPVMRKSLEDVLKKFRDEGFSLNASKDSTSSDMEWEMKALREKWGFVVDPVDDDLEYVFYIDKNSLPEDLYKRIVQHFQYEEKVGEEMREIVFPSIDDEHYRYWGPYPKDYYWGILFLEEMGDEDPDGEAKFKVSIVMPTLKEALSLFCKILRNANITEEVFAYGHCEDFSICYDVTYSSIESRAIIRNYYDNIRSLTALVQQVNEKFGTNYKEYEDHEFPLDDPETMEFIREGDLSAFFNASENGRLYGIQDSFPMTYEDMKKYCSNYTGISMNIMVVDFLCRKIYDLAYLIVHHDLGLNTDEDEIVIE